MSVIVISASSLAKTKQSVARLLAWQPLSLRGFLALLLGGLALHQLAVPEKDLAAAVLGGGVLALLGLMICTAFLLRLRLGRLLQAETHFDLSNPLSTSDIPAGLVLHNSSVPPYFSLLLRRSFEQSGARSRTHVVKGKEIDARRLIDTVFFPHRGLWTLSGLEVELRDGLGFTSFRWLLPVEGSIEVSAPTISIKPLPVVAASSRAGDQLDQARERSGDLFDLKPYDPSDGIKRILWKTYAKRGELVVRRPEPAIIPEGEVALYLIAARKDDHVAGALQHYTALLESQQITVLFGTDGIHFQPYPETEISEVADEVGAPAGAEYFCVDPDDSMRAINRSVWSRSAGTGSDFEAFLESLSLSNRAVSNVVVFAPAESAADTETLWFERLHRAAAVHSVRLTVALVPNKLEHGYFGEYAPLTPFEVSAAVPEIVRSTLGKRLLPKKRQIAAGELSMQITSSGSELLMVEPFE